MFPQWRKPPYLWIELKGDEVMILNFPFLNFPLCSFQKSVRFKRTLGREKAERALPIKGDTPVWSEIRVWM